LIGHAYFSDIQGKFYEFYKFQLISEILLEIKYCAQNFLHPGHNDPRSPTSGARESTQASTLDQVNLVSEAGGSHWPNGQDAGGHVGDDTRTRASAGHYESDAWRGRTKWSPGATPVTTGAAAAGDSRRDCEPEGEKAKG
jgi:hypothetical protein